MRNPEEGPRLDGVVKQGSDGVFRLGVVKPGFSGVFKPEVADLYQRALDDSRLAGLDLTITRTEGGSDVHYEAEDGRKISVPEGFLRVTIGGVRPTDISAFWKVVKSLEEQNK